MASAAKYAALAVLASVLPLEPALAQNSTPTIIVDSTNVALGQKVLVQGRGWPAHDVARVEVCGNAALNLSADCDLPGGVSAGVGADGSFSMLLGISNPGVPCPCVVRVTTAGSTLEAKQTIHIVGLPVEDPTIALPADPADTLEVGQPRLVRDTSWTTWFGASSQMTLLFSVRNIGSTPLANVPLSMVFGKGEDPTGFVASPDIGALNVGEATIVSLPVAIPALAWGTYKVKGTAGAPGRALGFETRTSFHPWGLVALAVLLAQLLLLLIRNRLRDRNTPQPTMDQDPMDDEPVPPTPLQEAAVATGSPWQPFDV